METITFKSTYSSVRRAGQGNKLNVHDFSLIKNISFILELVIRNTLKYNKLTCADEIYEAIALLQNERAQKSDLGSDRDRDIKSIENICEALCGKGGILIKLEKNFKNYYRLKYKEDI